MPRVTAYLFINDKLDLHGGWIELRCPDRPLFASLGRRLRTFFGLPIPKDYPTP